MAKTPRACSNNKRVGFADVSLGLGVTKNTLEINGRTTINVYTCDSLHLRSFSECLNQSCKHSVFCVKSSPGMK